MFVEWPRIEPEQDNELLEEAEKTLVEFLRSIYIKGIPDPLREAGTGGISLICTN